jgi:hypothetical protein
MASAAYYIGAVGQELLGSKGSYVGSIGTVLKAQSLPSGQYEIVSSQSPHKRSDPSTEEGRSSIQEFVDDVAQVMIEDIANFRSITTDKLMSNYGQGKVYAGPKAKMQGLIDKISTLGSVVESVAKEAETGSYRQQKRKVSAEAETLLSFTSEEMVNMGLRDLVSKFTASSETIDETAETLQQGQPAETTNESEGSVAAGATDGADAGVQPPANDPEAVRAEREKLEESFSDAAELFATQMTLAHRILPAEQAHAASEFLIARIDDSIIGSSVSFVDAEGQIVEGTREEAVRARYEARPKHSYTKRAIQSVRAGDTVARVLADEPKESGDEDSKPVSSERKAKLMGLSDLGQRVLHNGQKR